MINIRDYALARKEWDKANGELAEFGGYGNIFDYEGEITSYAPYNSKWKREGTVLTSTIVRSDDSAFVNNLTLGGFRDKLKIGETYIFSGYIAVDGEIPSRSDFSAGGLFSRGELKSVKDLTINPATGYFTQTFFLYDTYNHYIHAATRFTTGSVVKIKDFKIEKGYIGRNLVMNSDFSKGSFNTGSWSSNPSVNYIEFVEDDTFGNVMKLTAESSLDVRVYIDELDLIEGDTYVLSYYIRGSTGVMSNHLADNDNSPRYTQTEHVQVTEKWTRKEVVLPITYGSDGSRQAIKFSPTTDNSVMYVANIKLERGNKSTAWVPHTSETDMHPFVAEAVEVYNESKRNEEDEEALRNAIVAMGGSI